MCHRSVTGVTCDTTRRGSCHRVYVPDDPQLCHDLVHAHHSATVARHPRQWKTLELVLQNYWWPGLSRYVAKFIAGCDACNWCRRDISPMCKSPIWTGFDPLDVPCSLQFQNPAIRVLFFSDFHKHSKT